MIFLLFFSFAASTFSQHCEWWFGKFHKLRTKFIDIPNCKISIWTLIASFFLFCLIENVVEIVQINVSSEKFVPFSIHAKNRIENIRGRCNIILLKIFLNILFLISDQFICVYPSCGKIAYNVFKERRN